MPAACIYSSPESLGDVHYAEGWMSKVRSTMYTRDNDTICSLLAEYTRNVSYCQYSTRLFETVWEGGSIQNYHWMASMCRMVNTWTSGSWEALRGRSSLMREVSTMYGYRPRNIRLASPQSRGILPVTKQGSVDKRNIWQVVHFTPGVWCGYEELCGSSITDMRG